MSETVLEIHLPNLRHNYTFLRNQLSANTKLLAVVKAFGYGSDAVEIAKCLVAQGVDYLGVAYVHEGVALRKAGITTPILVLHPQLPNLDALIEYKLEPSVYGQRILDALLSKIKESNVSHYPVHLKFNTGLNRLGFDPKDATALLALFKDNALWLLLQGVYSHLAASDDEGENAFTKKQLKTFSEIVAIFSSAHPKTTFHVLNTSGVLRFPESQYNMVRTGISLYGYGNHPSVDVQLKPVLRLRTVISQIHILEKGDTLGYNRAFVAKTKTKTATLPLGHADGIGRIYGNGKGYVMINGQQASILGNVCMDMIMVNITGIDCKEGDEVIIFDENHKASSFAESTNTISYEVLTSVSQRVKRVFYR